MKKLNKKHIRKMTVTFIFSVAIVILITILILISMVMILRFAGVITTENIAQNGWLLTFLFIVASFGLGAFLSFVCSQIVLKPLNKLITGLNELSDGNYDVRVSLGKNEYVKELENKFNNLANELQNTEILKSDFINNFSHELKTPIVSISGLVKMMKNENLSTEKKQEYLQVIDEEIDRLSNMTTNVLNLSKYQNQSILTDKVTYNLSEQIRNCILLLEKRWRKKNLDLFLDFEEINITANEDMLMQVWVNIIDNAIKFSLYDKELKISIIENINSIDVYISNYGQEISEEDKNKIFNKFYQCESKESYLGNGIGLSIVKSVIDLHKGTVEVNCDNGLTTFIVKLPKINK